MAYSIFALAALAAAQAIAPGEPLVPVNTAPAVSKPTVQATHFAPAPAPVMWRRR